MAFSVLQIYQCLDYKQNKTLKSFYSQLKHFDQSVDC